MKALRFERNMPRFAAARVVSALAGSGKGVRVGPLELVEIDQFEMPGPDWVRVRPRLAGICGSDLAAIGCKGSPYFSPFISMPFVLGHELVGEVVETGRCFEDLERRAARGARTRALLRRARSDAALRSLRAGALRALREYPGR